MAAPEQPEPLSLLGGPLHDIGRRLGLVRGTNAVRLGLAIGIGWWLVVFALALAQGNTDRVLTLSLVGGHARLLLVIPLFFICESWVDPWMTTFAATIVRTGVVPASSQQALAAEVARVNRLANTWWPETACMIAAIGLGIAGASLRTYGTTGAYDSSYSLLAGLAYFRVGVTIFDFLLFRWAWKLALWSWFLWRVSRLDLRLIAGHPDRSGGLGVLEEVHERFTPLVAALSVLESASLAEAISTGQLAAGGTYPWLAMLLVVDCGLFVGPLLVFTDKLWTCRSNGLLRYWDLGTRYVTEFEAKWTDGNAPAGAPLLGTADLQSMADIANTVGAVTRMRWITAGPRLLAMMAMAALAPLAPLLLFEHPISDLTEKFFSRLIGL